MLKLSERESFFFCFSVRFGVFSKTACKVSRWLAMTTITAAYSEQFLLSLDRFLVIKNPSWYIDKCMYNKWYPIIATALNYTMMACVPFLLSWFAITHDPESDLCHIRESLADSKKYSLAVYWVFFCAVACCSILFLNIYIMTHQR